MLPGEVAPGVPPGVAPGVDLTIVVLELHAADGSIHINKPGGLGTFLQTPGVAELDPGQASALGIGESSPSSILHTTIKSLIVINPSHAAPLPPPALGVGVGVRELVLVLVGVADGVLDMVGEGGGV